MYPDTIIKWHDNSGIQTAVEPDYYENAPLYIVASSFDRGPEDIRVVYGQNFFDLYGSKMNFAKHGQPALQAANDINGGAKLLVKRIVAPDSLLANVVLCATLTRKKSASITTDVTNPNAVTYEQALEILNGTPYEPPVAEASNPLLKVVEKSFNTARSTTGFSYDVAVDTVLDTENTPIFPDQATGLVHITVDSRPGSYDRFTKVTADYTRPYGNQYLYKLVPEGETIVFPNLSDICSLKEYGGEYILWDGEEEVKIPEGYQYIMIIDCEKSGTDYIATAGGAVVANAKEQTMYFIQDTSVILKWEAVSVTGCKNHDDVVKAVADYEKENSWLDTDEETGTITMNHSVTFPLISISDNGRGNSSKSVKITPDYIVSRTQSNMFYTITVYDGTTRIEKCGTYTLNPYCIIDNTSYAITNDTSDQVIFDMNDDMYDRYFGFIQDSLGIDKEALLKHDIIFASTNVDTDLPGFELDPESIDLDSPLGIQLQNGSNGSFEQAPFGTEDYIEEMVSFFEGDFDDAIWDTDMYKVAAIFDANYPEPVKDTIFKFVHEREDCFYFRDLGIDVFSYFDIYAKVSKYKAEFKSGRFTGDYYTTYEIYDPETKKRIRTTMMYDFSRSMINHFMNSVAHPSAGEVNDMILPSAIEGTINFTPRKTPKVNQKQLLEDLRVNYAIFNTSGECVVNTLYTSQSEYTQLSYINNVLAMQYIARLLRETCPKSRYQFVTGNDFSNYENNITEVLEKHAEEFELLKFEYTQDDLQVAQKIFYASIYFRFKNWAQTEQFDLYALPVAVESES